MQRFQDCSMQTTVNNCKLCLYDDKLIFVFNLEYMKSHIFVPVNRIVCCDNHFYKLIHGYFSLNGIIAVYCTVSTLLSIKSMSV